MRKFGRTSRMARNSTATPLDLPTPVLPRSAKCLPSMSSTLMAASIEASCCGLPILMIAAPQVSNTMRRAVAAQEAGGVANHGIAGDITLKQESAVVMRADLAEKIHPCQRASGLRGSGLVGPVHVGDHRHHAGGVGLNAEAGADRDPRRFDGKLGVCVKADVG
jgi:hypothetical protein